MTQARAVTGRLLLVGGPLLGLLLAGCATDGRSEVRAEVEAVTAAANERDADGVRSAVDDLLAELDRQVRSNELTSAQAARIAARAREVQDSADLVDRDVLDAEREAREKAQEAAREKAAREAREKAEQDARAEAERKAQEEAAKKAEEEQRKAEEEARKAQEDAAKDDKKKKDEGGDESSGDGDG